MTRSISNDAGRSPLHFLGRFDDPFSGADRTLLEISGAVAAHRSVYLWSDLAPHPFFASRGVCQVDVPVGACPRSGMLLISGVHVGLGPWLARAGFCRVVVRYNLPNHGALFAMLAHLREWVDVEPEVFFVSEALRRSTGLDGIVEPSLIDIQALSVLPMRNSRQPVTVGRLSRDVPEKHHPNDPSLYRLLAAQGIRVRVMGGTCLPGLENVPGVEVLAAGQEPLGVFLQSLDIFFYRTGSFFEPYGRVVFEAMASGLPVVASTNGGYVEWLDGTSGAVLITSQEEAIRSILALARDDHLRAGQAIQAKQRAWQLHGPEEAPKKLAPYLRSA